MRNLLNSICLIITWITFTMLALSLKPWPCMERFNDDINVINFFDVFTSSKLHKKTWKGKCKNKGDEKMYENYYVTYLWEPGLWRGRKKVKNNKLNNLMFQSPQKVLFLSCLSFFVLFED